ncbi:MAG: bifunctional diaminohydroxyphosphoribosylaminopyrimidine deaminase/5-amino-6-(5-phosphoribosylamino)uracil reductase RibD [Candidatus Thiodiazotropha sp. (ex Notomyrtea botanica)]|nr:bifunctional diaminohydroxyphosphoribosylaminopyrimidine deaminase/5-amino-6-(5-phosphoribosylamino)uracil reductase RibD [Candidatus Thiodiazotropha sp. (ex Notomyrtea botanica)]
MSSDSDHRHMARAIRLARKGRYTTHPNPRVGCVLVKSGKVVGEGYHRRAGEPHAERNALAAAGAEAKGATAYVTLEPCCHHGRTPPCTEALIEAGVKRVVAAMLDPNPLVAGQGLTQLNAAGIEVVEGVMQAQAEALNPGFIKRMRKRMPFVRCKLAMSLDGRTAMASGESQWITSAAAREDVHRLRASSAAILTGIGTMQADDPSMNVRLTAKQLGLKAGLSPPQPLRVVLDPKLQTLPSANMLNQTGPVLLICGEDARLKAAPLEAAGAQIVTLPLDNDLLDLREVMSLLAEQEINEVLLESGAVLAGAMLDAGLIDELLVYLAPHLMGSGARGLFHLPELLHMSDRISLRFTDLRRIGDDIRITAVPAVERGE